MLPKDSIMEFQQIYKELYGVDLPFQEAEIQAKRVFFAVKATYIPLKMEWLKKMREGVKKNNGKINK